MRKIFPWNRNQVAEAHRIIRVNDSEYNTTKRFTKNGISTTKYNIITFLPKNLFEQFRRLANAFFLFLLILLFIPQISSLQPITTLLSLLFVLTVTAVKDAVDDFARYRSDRQVNNRRTDVLINRGYITTYWSQIQVGDIIRINNNDFIPADMILISTSEPNGLCLIETADLDGETNLKPREALIETVDLQDDLEKLSNFNAEIECELPNNNLLRFQGKLTWNGQAYPLKNDNVLLRGTRLRNTQWAIGVVCYAGRDTKLMQNSGKPKFKRTKIDHWLNKIIFGIFIFLFFMCLIMAICCGFWEYKTGYEFRIYLPKDSVISSDSRTGSAFQISALIFFSYIILLNTLVPISLYISIEFIRLLQSKLIDWDNHMYYQPNNIQAQARTASLNEELGQIQYIFSDKTGTLTQNIMTFKKCSIRGKLYGDTTYEHFDPSRAIKFAEGDSNFVWYDKTLIDAIEQNDDEYIQHFFTLLSLCHTVMTEDKKGKIIYQAQSPDENALVSAARSFGFAFMSRTQNSITARYRNKIETYELLNILDFNNYRKRMSVIVRKHGKILLYCKGADTMIKERLDPSEKDIVTITDDHLHKVACEGLRTLCLAWKELTEEDYQLWSQKLKQATTSMENRDEKIDELYEEIEKNLRLIGMTAIEDKLQTGVPQCIENLTKAGINIWMLTGDKTETAENIALSCKLLTDNMILKTIDGDNETDVNMALDIFRSELIQKIEELYSIHIDNNIKRITWKNLNIDFRHANEDFGGFCLLITGSALVSALSDRLKMKFLELSTLCKTVICCRVTPLQKAQVVQLVMNNDNVITLAIGDGANDVSMIQKAHIGVGISGQEGRQAVLASDYSIGQFRYLERLLLVHGRWSYMRTAKFLRYFFYKNFAFTFCQFWFAIYCGFSAQTIFDAFFVTVYNIFFTTCPVLALGVTDQDISASHSINKPHLYKIGQKDKLFNKKVFIECALHGLITSCIIFFFSYLCLLPNQEISDHQSFSFLTGTILVIVVNLENAIEMWFWTWIYIVVLLITIALHFIFHFVMYSITLRDAFKINYPYVGIAETTVVYPTFWFTLILICSILILPVIAREFFRIRFTPTEIDKARLAQKYHKAERKGESIQLKRRSRRRADSALSTASGYAFSQQKGWGSKITSGTLRNKTILSYIDEQTRF